MKKTREPGVDLSAAAAGCPPKLRPHLLDSLEKGALLVVILDAENRMTWANPAFCRTFLAGRKAKGLDFRELLSHDCAPLLSHIRALAADEAKTIELRHPIAAGMMTIGYQFFPAGGGSLIGIGNDLTEEKELIGQLTILIEDLHREVARRAELSAQLQEMARTDFLTGVANRREFDGILNQEWRRTRRYGTPFCLLILDLDHFKLVNDRFGHQVGDEVLQRVAKVLQAEVRAEDVVARYGGEEFAVIALSADEVHGREIGERLRHRISVAEMPAGVETISVSIGIAAAAGGPGSTGSMADLVGRADRALYLAKEKGRNRVEG